MNDGDVASLLSIESLRSQFGQLLELYDWEYDVIEVRCVGEVAPPTKRLYPFSLYAEPWRWLQDSGDARRTWKDKTTGKCWMDDAKGGLNELLRLNRLGYNVYFGVNPRRTRLDDQCYHGAKRDVARVRVCHADVDGIRPEEAEAVLGRHSLRASAIVATNTQVHGCHVYLAWQEAAELIGPEARAEIERLESLNRRIISIFKADAKSDDVQDVSRILRVPGMVNWPDKRKREHGRVPSLCRLHSCDPERLYTHDEIDRVLPPLADMAWSAGFGNKPANESETASGPVSPGAPPDMQKPRPMPTQKAYAYDASAEPERIRRAIEYMRERVWPGDVDDPRSPMGVRNCRDMRILAHDMNIGVAAALDMLAKHGHGPEMDERLWVEYLNNYCKSEPGNKELEILSDEEMLDVVFVPGPNQPEAP